MHLKCKDWKRFWRKKRLQRAPEWPSYNNFRKVTQNPYFFLKKCKGGTKGNFSKNRPKSSPQLKGPKALWRKCHYPLNCIHLKCKDWRRVLRKKQLQNVPNDQVMAVFATSAKTRIFWKSAKGGPREMFQKSPKKLPTFERPKSTLAQITSSSI